LISKKMVNHTVVALVELSVEETGVATTTGDDTLAEEGADANEKEWKGGPEVLEVKLTDEEEAGVAPPAVPDGATLSW
jgi:hypothetical protein